MSEWISIKNNLPSDNQTVIVWAHGYASDYVEISKYKNNEFTNDNVTHWQPLPLPPED